MSQTNEHEVVIEPNSAGGWNLIVDGEVISTPPTHDDALRAKRVLAFLYDELARLSRLDS
jgi:hypothetical protein